MAGKRLNVLLSGLHRVEVWSKLLMSRPTATRSPFSKCARQQQEKLGTIWAPSFHLKHSYRPEARWLLYYEGKHWFAISSRHSLLYKLFLLSELAPHTIRTTSNLLTVLLCSTTKSKAERCNHTPCVIHTIMDCLLQVRKISFLRPQFVNPSFRAELGSIEGPGTEHLFWNVEGSLNCSHYFIPAANQSVTVTIDILDRLGSDAECQTGKSLRLCV